MGLPTYVVRDPGVLTSARGRALESHFAACRPRRRCFTCRSPKEAAISTPSPCSTGTAGHVPDHVYTIPHFDFILHGKEDDVMAISGGPDPVVADPASFRRLHLARERGISRDGCALGRRDVWRVQWKDVRPDVHLASAADSLFIEPMITKAFLESTSSFTTELKQPESVQRGGLYPKRYSIRHEPPPRSTASRSTT